MDFEEILANCLDALERGETIEGCLARYPKYAAELAPLLRLATTVRSAPQPRLSAKAFERVRTAMVAHARYQHALHRPFINARHKTAQTKLPQRQPALRTRRASSPLLAQKSRRFNSFVLVQRTTGAFVSLALLLCLITLARNISISLPNTLLYPVKILGENMQGVLLTAAGEEVAWQAQQAENRLQELLALGQQGQAAPPELLKTIDADIQSTLAASKNMPLAQRNQFLMAWVARLQALGKNQTMPPLVTLTLNRAVATVETATQVTIAPATRPLIQATSAATALPALVMSPTPILVPTPNPVVVTPMVVKAAPTEVVATATQIEAEGTNPVLQFPTHAPEAPIVIETTPTAAIVVVQIPQENSSNNAGQNNDHARAAQSQPEPTTNPAAMAASTTTVNAANSNDNSSTRARASHEMTTSVDTAPDAATAGSTEATAVLGIQASATAETATPVEPVETETTSVAPVKSGTPTRALTPVGTSIRPSDTPAPVTPQPSNTPSATSIVGGTNPATPTQSSGQSSGQLSGTTPVATASSSHTQKTPTPTREKTPTTKPTEVPQSTDTPMPAATPTPTDAPDRATVEPSSQPTPVSTVAATSESRKSNNGK